MVVVQQQKRGLNYRYPYDPNNNQNQGYSEYSDDSVEYVDEQGRRTYRYYDHDTDQYYYRYKSESGDARERR